MQPDFITSLEKLDLQDCLVLIGVLTNRSISLLSKQENNTIKAVVKELNKPLSAIIKPNG